MKLATKHILFCSAYPAGYTELKRANVYRIDSPTEPLESAKDSDNWNQANKIAPHGHFFQILRS